MRCDTIRASRLREVQLAELQRWFEREAASRDAASWEKLLSRTLEERDVRLSSEYVHGIVSALFCPGAGG